MHVRSPFFLLRTRAIMILILFIIGLGLLIVYGSKAISSASDHKYVEGWQNRPFRSPAVFTQVQAGQDETEADFELLQKVEADDNTANDEENKSDDSKASDHKNQNSDSEKDTSDSSLSQSVRRVLRSLGF